ncbi:MAG: septum formation initiator family protein [Verrucomicrobia bacterium]|nr:septum formation initiator family protein [Verrucomicrobiota bacterium]
MNSRQLIAGLYVILFLGFGVGAGVLFFDARAEYNQLKLAEAASRQKLAAEEARLVAQQKILDRLRTDPAYVEKVLRARWGYARPGEVIYRFPE